MKSTSRNIRGKSKKRYIASYLRFLVKAGVALNRMLRKGLLDAVHVHNMPNFIIFAAILPALQAKPSCWTCTTRYPKHMYPSLVISVNKVCYLSCCVLKSVVVALLQAG